MSEESEEVVLETELAVEEGRTLALRYRVVNGLNRDIFLFTPLVDFRGNDWRPIPARVYVSWAEKGRIELSKRLWAVPEEVDVYMPEVPFLTRVPAGERFSEELELPLPLLVNHPYRFPEDEDADAGKHREARAAHFSIGYLVSGPDHPHPKPAPEAGQEFYRIDYGSGIEHQRILEGEGHALEVPVRG